MADLTLQQQQDEWLTCAESPAYFTHHYGQIYDSIARAWVPFHLWPAQVQALRTIHQEQLTIVLKARQIGLTWLCLAYELWGMIFQPIATALNFSKRDDEAVHLLSKERLRGIYDHLPEWLKARAVVGDNDHEFALSNGSVARAFPSTAGDSYTATFALVDEADLVADLKRLMGAVKPTIDAGGKMVLLSRADKSKPNSEFKSIYRAAKAGSNKWRAVFLPWHVRPGRTLEWYAAECQNAQATNGSLDTVHEQYPGTDAEALAPNSQDKRLSSAWLQQCYAEVPRLDPPDAPAIPGLYVWREPQPEHNYVLGADPAEGNPSSDDSSLHVLDAETGEEVAALTGKYEPSVFAAHIDAIGVYYNHAAVLVERNNHGHAVLLWLAGNSGLSRLTMPRDSREGWHTNVSSKSLLYTTAAEAFRETDVIVHSFSALTQLQSITANTLSAPTGEHDDRAMSFVLAVQARLLARIQAWV